MGSKRAFHLSDSVTLHCAQALCLPVAADARTARLGVMFPVVESVILSHTTQLVNLITAVTTVPEKSPCWKSP